jgi:hypothetical protein
MLWQVFLFKSYKLLESSGALIRLEFNLRFEIKNVSLFQFQRHKHLFLWL